MAPLTQLVLFKAMILPKWFKPTLTTPFRNKSCGYFLLADNYNFTFLINISLTKTEDYAIYNLFFTTFLSTLGMPGFGTCYLICALLIDVDFRYL